MGEDETPVGRDKREAEMRWLGENRDYLWQNFAGKWIAVDGSQLVGFGETAEQALNQARQAGHKDPLLTGVRKREYQGLPLILPS